MATALKVGQIAIIGFNAGATLGGYTTEDRFHFVLLAPIEAGTQIFFTDRAWNGSSFTTGAGDGTFTYTAATNIAAGTVISITQAQLTAAGIDLSTSGDAIYVYQGTDANTPTKFLFAAEVADGNYTFNGSLVNTGLANGVSALAIAEDSGAYAGPTTDAYAHFFNNAGLLGNIVDASNWNTDEHGLNIAIDQHDQSGPFGTASDLSLWLAASGGGNGIASTNVDSTVSGGAVGYNLIIRYTTDTGDTVQTFANPRDIAFDTAEGKFFIIDSNAGGGTNVILQGNISDLIGNPSVPPTMTVLFSSSQATTLEKQIRDMQIDTINNIIYFTHGQRIEKIGYNTANQTSTVLATLGGTGSGNPFGTTNSGFADDFVIDFNSGTIYFSVHRVIAGEDGDAVSRNYVGKITGLTANSGANAFSWSGGQITVLPFSPDDNDTLHPLDLTGESFPQELGTVEGLALSPDGQTLYFTTASILWDHDGDGGYPTDGNPATTDPLLRMGGVYSYALSNNPNGAYTTIWQQADDGDTNSQAISTVYGPQGLLDDIEVDPVTGQLYFLDLTGDQLIINGVSQNPQGDEGVWRINADGSGLVFVQGVHNGTTNSNTLGAGSLFLNRAPVVTSSTQAVTGVIESSSTLSSGATALVQPFLSLDVTDAETASNPTQQLHSATVWISSNFQSGSTHQDRLTINGTTSGTINGVSYLYNSTTGVMTLTGAATFSVYEALIASVRFNTSGDDPTAYGAAPTRTISWTVSDGLNHSDPVTATVAVTGINDAPVITLANGIVGTSEDSTNFVLSGISVTDVDADPATQNVVATFSVPSGTLTLATNVAGGITAGQITAGANGSGTITVTATQNQINATLASGLTYTPPANHNGVRNLTVTVNDQGFNGNDPASTGTGTTEEGSAVLQISVVAVNDAPVVTGDGTESATTILEDTPSSTGQTVSELFGGQYSDPTDEVSGGSSAQAFAGVAIVGNGSSAATGQWQYWTGSAWADIGTASSASAKLISAATPLRFNPAQDYNGAAPTLTVHLIDASGAAITNGSTVNLSGVGGTGGTTRYSAGTVVLSQSVTAVNDAPVNTVPGARTASEDTAHAITGLSVSDVDADAATSLVTVTLRVLRGVLDIRTDVAGGVTAAQVSGDGGNVVTITATRSAINATFAASDGVVYQGPVNFNGFDTLTVTTNDQGTQGLDPGLTANALSEEDVDTVAITVVPVNDAPVVNGTGAVTINDIAEDVPTGFLAVSTLFLGQYSDPADESDTSNPQNPAGVVVVGNASSASTGQWQYWSGSAWINIGVVSNSAAMLIHVDAAIRFNPAPNYNGPAPTLTVRLVDESQGAITTGTVVNLSGAGAVGGTSRYSSGTISTSLNVLSLNDAPVLTAPDFTNILTENVAGPIFSSDSVVFSDVDSSDYAGGSLTVAKSSAIETLALRTTGAVTLSAGMTAGSVVSVNGVAVGVIATGGTGAGADNLVISLNANATAARMSTLVKELTYVSTENNPSLSATVNITLVDGDGRANGGDDDGSVTIGFYVNPVNDDPTLTSPVGLTADQNGVVTLTGFTIADIDSSGIFYVSMMTPTGAYTAPSVDGVSAVVNGQYLSLSGTLAAINAYLAAGKASVTLPAGSASDTTLQVQVSDGSGGSAFSLVPVEDSFAGPAAISLMLGGNDQAIPDSQGFSSLAALPDGGYVLAWTNNGEIAVRRFNTDGTPIDAQQQVNTYTTGAQFWTSVTVLTDGGFVVTWMSAAQDGSGYGVYGQRFDADGDKAGAEFRINTYTTWDQMAPSVTALVGGGFVVTWLSAGQDGGSYGVYAQRYTNGGAAAGGEFRVTSTTAPDQSLPNVTALAGGGFVVVWYSAGQDGSDSAVYGRRFAADGTALAAEFQVNTYTTGDQGYDASVGALEDGGFVVVWTSEGQDGSGEGIYAQRYTAGGVKVGGEFRVNTYTADDQDSGNVVGLSDGGFIVTWTSMGQDGESGGLYAQRYDVDGQPVGTEFRVNQTAAGYQYTDGHSPGVTVTETADGSIVFTWYGLGDVYVRQFTPTDFSGAEDTAMALHLGLNTTEAEETIASVTLSGLPQGAVLSAGTDNGDGSWTLTAAQVAGLTLTPPLNYNGSFDLTVTVVTQDGVSTETSSATQTVTVSAVNDAPAVSAPDSIDVEGATPITGVSVSDVDAGGAVVVATLSVPSGSLAAVSGSGVTVGGTASALTLTGTIANINAFIAASKVVFTPEPGNVADPTLTISVNDGGSSGTGGAQVGGDTVTLVVPDENLPPSIGSSTISVTEDTPTAITGLSFSDPDAGTDPIVVTLSVPAGALTAESADGVTVGGTASALTLTGSVAAINAFIAGGAVIYTPAENASADVTLSVHADDQGHNGPPGVNTAEEEVTLDLQPVNDAPEITGPAGVGSTEDAPLPLTSITISDVDAGSSSVTLTLSVPAGSLAATSGAGVTVGGTAAAMTLTGTVAAINAFIAASKVVYTPVLNSTADVTVTATVSDNGHAGSGGALEDSTSWTVTLSAVNDAPTASAPASIGVTEDAASAVTGISFADVDAGMATVTVTLSVPTGSLAAGPGDGTVTVGGTASALTLTGTIGHINAFIAASNVTYTTVENATGNVTLTASIDDGGATGMNGSQTGQTTTTLTVSAVNDAPVVTVPGSATVTEDVAGAITGISFADVDAGSNPVVVTLSVPSGALAATSAAGVTVGGTASALTLTGTVANINAFIAASNVTFTTAQNATGSVTVTAAINDGGHAGSGGARTDSAQFTVDVTAVNDAPTASAPANIAVTEDVASAVTGITFADIDAGSATVTATLSVPSGSLAATSGGGVTVGGTAASLTLTGTVAAINAFIAASGVTYTTVQNATADVTLTASLNDEGNSGTGGTQSGQTTTTLAVTAVNDAPTVALPSDVEGVPGTPKALTGLVISDVDAGSGTVTATISAPAGTFTATSGACVGVAGSGTSTLTLSGTVAAINAFIAAGGVAFNPSTSSGASVVVTLSVDDGGNGGVDPGLSGTGTSEAVSAGFTVSLLIPITGTGGSDGLTGGSRNEFLDAGEGDDRLSGGGGDDRLDGGTGDDRLDGGTGADQLNGGDGIDTVVYGSSAVTVNLQTGVNAGHAAGDTFSSIERYTLSSAGDQFVGSNGDDWVEGLAGNDTLNGGLGADTLIGSGGMDKLYGEAGADVLSGGNDNDQLYGGADADVLEGGFGADLIEGGAGADMLSGGVGPDTFVFGNDALDGSTDRILDFQKLVDKIDLRAIDANTLVGGDQAFVFVTGGLTGQAGQAAISYSAGTNTTTVLLDVNGDGIADLTILVNGSTNTPDWLL